MARYGSGRATSNRSNKGIVLKVHLKPLQIFWFVALNVVTALVSINAAADAHIDSQIDNKNASPHSTTAFSLSDSEQEWLADHPEIRVGAMDAWPPLNFVENGVPRGIGVDFLDILNQRLGGCLKVIPGNFDDNMKHVKSRALDAIMDVTPKPERKKFLNFTRPYLMIPHIIVTQKGAPMMASEHDLAGKTVAIERGFYNVTYFKVNYPDVIVREYDDTSKALDAVSRGEADAYAGNRAVAMYLIKKELLANLNAQGRLQKPPVALTLGIRKDWPILATLLDRAIASISVEETLRIHSKWLEIAQMDRKPIMLTREERVYLENHPVIRMGYDINWLPVERVDENGVFVGLSADYFELIEQRLNVQFETIAPRPWKKMIGAIKTGEATILTAVTQTEQRKVYLDFTEPYLSLPMVLVTREDITYINNMSQLHGKRVGVLSGYASEDLLKKNHPRILLSPSTDIRDALLSVVRGETFAFIGSLPFISQVISQEGLGSLKVSGETPYKFDLRIGVARGNQQLVSALQKALDTITEDEIATIHRKWFKVTYSHKTDYRLMVQILVISVIVIVVFLLWNRRLSREVSRRIRIENQLKEAKKRAESADHLKSAFLAAMSHELRTPLNSIIGFTGILLQHLAGPLNEEQTKQLTIVKNAGQHLLNLINDVLDISKIEAGQLSLRHERFDLFEAIESAIATVSPLAEKKRLELQLRSESSATEIESDRRRVEQVLINLVNNAVKFTDEGGVYINVEKNTEEIAVSVEDTGIGIKEEDISRLFKAFTQVDSGISRQREGTGLGLSISKKLVHMLGGRISVASKWSEGSTFTFTLPYSKEHPDGSHTDNRRQSAEYVSNGISAEEAQS